MNILVSLILILTIGSALIKVSNCLNSSKIKKSANIREK